jgi:glyoxylase-like metal-dependent hydrolase (beta-lactamase superfamily II)
MSEPIYFKQLEIGPMQNYVYLFGDPETRDAAVVDAAWDIDAIVEVAGRDGYKITKNLVTHFHPDHLGGDLMGHQITGAVELAGKVGAKTYIHKQEVPFVHRVCGLSDSTSGVEGGTPPTSAACATFLHTPGHTPGSASRRNTCTRRQALHRLGGRVICPARAPRTVREPDRRLLVRLPDETVLLPGHNTRTVRAPPSATRSART